MSLKNIHKIMLQSFVSWFPLLNARYTVHCTHHMRSLDNIERLEWIYVHNHFASSITYIYQDCIPPHDMDGKDRHMRNLSFTNVLHHQHDPSPFPNVNIAEINSWFLINFFPKTASLLHFSFTALQTIY